jgi:hypothetical protein
MGHYRSPQLSAISFQLFDKGGEHLFHFFDF